MSTRTPAGDKGTADRIEADDGGYWVRLVTWQALDREGGCMKHCVGDGSYDELVGGEEVHDDAIWSLRGRNGLSVLTVRIRHRELNYAKGYSNHAPGKGAAMQVRHLVAAFKAAGHALEVSECETEIVLLPDGRTFRRDRLPPEVQAEIQERDARRWGHRHSLSSGQYEMGTPTVMFLPADAPPGTPFRDLGTIVSECGGEPAFMLTHDFPDPVIRMYQRPDGRGQRYLTRSGIQFDVRPDALSATGPAQARNEAFLRIYRAAIERAARARSPEPGVPMGPGGGGGGLIFTPDHPTGWATVLGEQAAEVVSYGHGAGGGGPAMRTVAIGVDTQPAPATETSPGPLQPFVEHSMRYLASCLDQPYEVFAGEWRATAERAEFALLSERFRACGLFLPAPTVERSRPVHSLPALGLPYGTRPSGDRS